MENATKAIIMAGAVLISIILISIGVALWNNYANFSEQNAKNTRNQQLNEFNVKFEKYAYNGNKTSEVSAQDVKTIVNLAKDYNNKYDEELIKVTYNGNSQIVNWTETQWVEFFNKSNPNESGEETTFKIYMNNINSDIISKIEIEKAM